MFYHQLRKLYTGDDRKRVVDNLQRLRKGIRKGSTTSTHTYVGVPPKDADDNLLIGSWNIRDFDKSTKRGFGRRKWESLYYIAEVVSHFDILAVQEINNLDFWEDVMRILGSNWDYVCSDVTHSSIGGNGERMTFVYDKRKVSFKNMAGEIVLPDKYLITVDDNTNGKQFRRTPYLASFQSGWFRFDLCTVHIYYGSSSGSKLQQRIQEINSVAKYLSEFAQKTYKTDYRSLILLGDFNIVSPTHKTMEALKKNGFTTPPEIGKSNATGTMHYDQIAFKKMERVIDYKAAGVVELFKSIMKPSEWEKYKSQMRESSNGKNKSDAELKKYFNQWKTYHFSDHMPIWVQLKVNNSDEYLNYLKTL